MAGKPKSALASLLDQINSTDQNQAAVAEAGVSIPNVEEPKPTFEHHQEHPVAEPYTEVTTTTKLINVEPDDCILWAFADRPDEEMGDITALADSMKENGQQEPILVRPNTQNTKHRYEVIFGNRRWRAARSKQMPLMAIVKSMTDQEAALFQKEENENRKDLSDYARARSYRKQIDSGVFDTETELSKSLNLSKRTLNDIMAYIRVPKTIIDAIPNYASISRTMALKLSILAKDKSMHDKLIKLGPQIGNGSIKAVNIEMELNKKQLTRTVSKIRDIQNSQGKKIGKLKCHPSGMINISIDAKYSSRVNLDNICKQLAEQCSNDNQ